MSKGFFELSAHLTALLDADPYEAIRQARGLNSTSHERLNVLALQAAIFVDGGALTNQVGVINEGVTLWRALYDQFPRGGIAYNLANGLVAAAGRARFENIAHWLDDQERTAAPRAEARRLYWKAIQSADVDSAQITQAWTNLANQFSASFRLGEAHDARLAALAVDPHNGVAAIAAARDLLWLFEQGGCSELTRVEAIMMARIARQHPQQVVAYAGAQAAQEIMKLASEFDEPAARSRHADPFIAWVEKERLTLSPAVELVDPQLGKIDWLMLPGIRERETDAPPGLPPPIFAMFNVLKSDFILAREIAWRARAEESWPCTGRFADTLDYARYGPSLSAWVLAHRTALDLLDKVAVAANHYFELGIAPSKVYFGKIWREQRANAAGIRPLLPTVSAAIRNGARALYGLVELADDYESEDGILRPHKDLRNAATHRFVVLHDLGGGTSARPAAEIEHLPFEEFTTEVVRALRVARSAIQTFALAATQHERQLDRGAAGFIGQLIVPDHDQIRGGGPTS